MTPLIMKQGSLFVELAQQLFDDEVLIDIDIEIRNLVKAEA
jgi:hypothetical protein